MWVKNEGVVLEDVVGWPVWATPSLCRGGGGRANRRSVWTEARRGWSGVGSGWSRLLLGDVADADKESRGHVAILS